MYEIVYTLRSGEERPALVETLRNVDDLFLSLKPQDENDKKDAAKEPVDEKKPEVKPEEQTTFWSKVLSRKGLAVITALAVIGLLGYINRDKFKFKSSKAAEAA